MTDKLIFVSCGQQTAEEKRVGASVKQLVDSKPGYKAYFAEYVRSLDALAKNIFDGLRMCSGVISFMHERGFVKIKGDTEWGYRSSVWVNQEIAILAYRQQYEGIEIPILIFKDEKVRLEGAMTSLIANPIIMKSESETLTQINSWLISIEFPFKGVANDDRFNSKWKKLTPMSRKVIAALLEEGGINVKESSIKSCLRDVYKIGKNEASKAVSDAGLEFIDTDLVKLMHNIYSGDEMSINPTWDWHIKREIKNIKG